MCQQSPGKGGCCWISGWLAGIYCIYCIYCKKIKKS